MVEKGNENCAISIFLEAFLFCFMIVSPIAFYMRFETPPQTNYEYTIWFVVLFSESLIENFMALQFIYDLFSFTYD